MVFGLEFYEIHALDKVSEEDVKDKMNCVVVGFIVSQSDVIQGMDRGPAQIIIGPCVDLKKF